MPGWLRAFADHQPITIVANALRGLTLGPEALPPGHTVTAETLLALAWTCGLLAVCAPLAVRAYRRADGDSQPARRSPKGLCATQAAAQEVRAPDDDNSAQEPTTRVGRLGMRVDPLGTAPFGSCS
jgi:hypothetical protein